MRVYWHRLTEKTGGTPPRWFGFLLLLVLAGCSSTPDEVPTQPVETLYREGVTALKKERFKTATKRFQEVDRKHPFSPWAVRAQTNLIYAWFKQEEYADAISAAERFIRLHPRNQHVAYAYYMRGLSFYKQISSAVQDQSQTREALTAFQELVSRFPKSDYAWEAQQMLVLCRDRLAEQEMVVARYYLDQEEYIAAIRRFNQVLDNPMYRTTPYAEEALFSLVLASQRLGLAKDARTYASVLGHNFPDRPFYRHAVALLEGDHSLTRWTLVGLRQGVAQKNMVARFFQGLAPAMVPGSSSEP